MNCFENLVGLRDACGDDLITSLSGLYLNDLPGISLDGIDRKLNREHENAVDLITKQLRVAEKLLLSRSRSKLGSMHDMRSLVENKSSTEWRRDQKLQAAQANFVGIYVKVPAARHAVFNAFEIQLLLNHTGNVDVNMWNLDTGEILETQTVAVIAGEIATAVIDWQRPAMGKPIHVFIGYDQTGVSAYASDFNSDACIKCQGGYINYKYLQVHGRKAAATGPVNHNTLKSQTGTSGLCVSFSLYCTMDFLLCSQKQLMAVPLWYKAGELILQQMRYSDTLSLAGLAFQSEYEALSAAYMNDFEKELESVLSRVRLPTGACFACLTVARNAVQLP